jgi:hypothetical protein
VGGFSPWREDNNDATDVEWDRWGGSLERRASGRSAHSGELLLCSEDVADVTDAADDGETIAGFLPLG